MTETNFNELTDNLDIAVIGMSCLFPGAANIDEFWRNLRDGVESIRTFTDEQMEALGVDPAALRSPNFVKAGSILENVGLFDAAFFGYSPKEAAILDPQHRIFLECAWQAVENAGYNPDTYDGLIGVYAGLSLSTYLLFNLLRNPEFQFAEDTTQAMIANDKDFLSTRVSYELNLKGPSLDVQTACSTSLVAVHLACNALLGYQCDMALAGGVSIQVPQRTGYFYQEGGVVSPDGHCRAFDAKAQGTVFGNGAGIVVLKRLTDALADKDSIYAVIKGSAINNDGSNKVGFTAPSIDGQAQAISMALMVSGVEAETITYVETHGTATALGDPVEVAALTKSFRTSTEKSGYCAIGSIKTNIGHLDAAAGVAGLIKTVLAIKNKMLPPSLHFEEPNPKIDFESSPFYVNSRLKEWTTNGIPRRAGVSSFGIGGTNAHVIVEQAPRLELSGASRAWQFLALSAKTPSALDQMTQNLAAYLKDNPGVNLADVAYTLQVGRKPFNYRRISVCSEIEDAVNALEGSNPRRVMTMYQEPGDRPVVFMFPGGGAQYVNMGLDLYQHEPVFRDNVDLCSDLLMPQLGFDLRDYLFPSEYRVNEAAERLKQTFTALPALFVIEYSLAKLWMYWGVLPKALIGHSLGEYVAAFLAGVFSLQDALTLVVARGRLFEQLPRGAMLSVGASEADVTRLMSEELSIAAINASTQCVVSGPADAISSFSDVLAGQDIDCTRIHIEVAAHSQMVEPILGAFRQIVEKMQLNEPNIPLISNVTGSWITGAEATDPHYWEAHLRSTVRFSQGLEELSNDASMILLEVGPGHSLCSLAKMRKEWSETAVIMGSMRHALEKGTDGEQMVTALGKLWASGVSIDWGKYYEGEGRRREAVPGYAFQRQRYWVEAGRMEARGRGEARGKRKEIGEWFYASSWRMKQEVESGEVKEKGRRVWMVMEEGGEVSREIVGRLRGGGEEVIEVSRGGEERSEGGGEKKYRIGGGSREGYEEVLRKLEEEGRWPTDIIHLWSLNRDNGIRSGKEFFEQIQNTGFYSLIFLAQALAQNENTEKVNIWVVTNGLAEVESTDKIIAEKATMLGPCKVIPQEMPHINIRCLDLPEAGRLDKQVIDQLMKEVRGDSSEVMIAFRGKKRWVQSYEPVRMGRYEERKRELVEGGVYLITGGLGGVGQIIGEYLAREVRARLILVGRRGVGEREEWERRIMQGGEKDEEVRKIKAIKRMEEEGAEVVVEEADVADYEQMRGVVERVYGRYGQLNGVFHMAGLTGAEAVKLIQEAGRADCERNFRAKVYGTYVLKRVLEQRRFDFCLLFSSVASILGGLGLAAYSAANLFMDSFSSKFSEDENNWLSVNWDGWMAATGTKPALQTSLDQYSMTPDEGLEALRRVLTATALNQVIVSTGDLNSRFNMWIKRENLKGMDETEGGAPNILYTRPALGTPYVPPSNEVEETIVKVWQESLGIEQLGVDDNFFDLGGNSLVGLKVMSRLKKELNVDIPVVALFEGPTVKALAKVISQGVSQRPTYAEDISRGEKRREKRKRKRIAAEGSR